MKRQDLQAILEERASNKLRKEIKDYLNAFRDHKLFNPLSDQKILPSNQDLSNWFYYTSDGNAYKLIFDKLLPSYIDQEIKEFMSKVENIQNQIDEIKDSLPY